MMRLSRLETTQMVRIKTQGWKTIHQPVAVPIQTRFVLVPLNLLDLFWIL